MFAHHVSLILVLPTMSASIGFLFIMSASFCFCWPCQLPSCQPHFTSDHHVIPIFFPSSPCQPHFVFSSPCQPHFVSVHHNFWFTLSASFCFCLPWFLIYPVSLILFLSTIILSSPCQPHFASVHQVNLHHYASPIFIFLVHHAFFVTPPKSTHTTIPCQPLSSLPLSELVKDLISSTPACSLIHKIFYWHQDHPQDTPQPGPWQCYPQEKSA